MRRKTSAPCIDWLVWNLRRGAVFAGLWRRNQTLAGSGMRRRAALVAEETTGAIILQLHLKLAQGINFDLPDAFTRQADFATDLLQGQRLLTFEPKSKFQHAGIALID